MKWLFLWVVSCSAFSYGKEADPAKQRVIELAERYEISVRLDQPYAGNDNPKQQVDVYVTKQPRTKDPLPVVALIHGGGWVNGDRLGFAGKALQLARSGNYAVVAVGYRLSKEASWPAQVHDCKAAIRWIRGQAKELNLDPDRIAVWGSSAGGHLSALLGTSGDVKALEGELGAFTALSSRVAAVVNLCGPSDFTQALMFTAEGEPIVQDDAVSGLLGGTYQEKPEVAKAASPVTYVSADDPPFVTFHGTADQRVAFRHAETLHEALQKAGVKSLLVPITDGAHGSVSAPEVMQRGELFLDQVLRGEEGQIDLSPIPAPEEKRP
jgi:acetyl esterase/lipase